MHITREHTLLMICLLNVWIQRTDETAYLVLWFTPYRGVYKTWVSHRPNYKIFFYGGA